MDKTTTWIFLQVALSLWVLEVHINGIMGISIHITESKIHISYLKHHDSTLMMSSIIFTCHPFQPSSISLLRICNTFSISSPFDVTKLQKKISWCLIDWQVSIPNVSGHAYSYPLPLNLDLNEIERVIIHLRFPENYSFDTIISDYFYRLPFTPYLCGC